MWDISVSKASSDNPNGKEDMSLTPCPLTLPTFPVTPSHALGETQSIGNSLLSEPMGP